MSPASSRGFGIRSGADRARRLSALVSAIVTAGALVLGLVLFAPDGAWATGHEPPRPRLLVIGDSVILGTQNNIAANLPEWDVTFDAAVSRSTAAGMDVVAAHGTDFSVVVVALGANDGGTPGVFTPRVATLLDALGGVPHVVWLTIHEARPYYAQTNQIIRDQVAGHPNAIVADWNAAIRPGDVGDDGLHLTGQGSVAMAAWVAAVVRLVAAPPPTTTTPTTTTTTTTTIPPSTTSPPPSTSVVPPSDTGSASRRAPSIRSGTPIEDDPGRSTWLAWGLPIGIAAMGGAGVIAFRRRK